MTGLPTLEYWWLKFGVAAGIGLLMYWILSEGPGVIIDFKRWRKRRKQGHLEEVELHERLH
jgi:hypothetical protein